MKISTNKLRKTLLIGGLLVSTLFVVAVVIATMTDVANSAQQAPVANGWQTVITETFETDFTTRWAISDTNGATDGEYYWATTNYTAAGGSASAWATGGGADGSSLTPGTDDYPNDALSRMITGPVTLSDTDQVRLSFDYWSLTESSVDSLLVRISSDGSSYTTVASVSGDSNGWQNEVVSLDSYAGANEVWLSFFFSSNAADTDLGVFVDNIHLEALSQEQAFFPLARRDPTSTPTPTPTPSPTPTPTPSPTPQPFYYYDDFSDPDSGWPEVDHTHDPSDCFEWYYEAGAYKSNICDDRTDVKVSPLVPLPDEDYLMETDARFRVTTEFENSYGIMFDAKDDPDPDNPDLGDYYMVWVLWHSTNSHIWRILKDVPGDQLFLTEWQELSSSYYDYSDSGQAWNTWRIERTDERIRVYVNDHQLADVGEDRPTTNQQILFGLFSSTYETGTNRVSFDNVFIDTLNGASQPWQGTPQPFYSSGTLDLDELLQPNSE